jgi:hypothetical protein
MDNYSVPHAAPQARAPVDFFPTPEISIGLAALNV